MKKIIFLFVCFFAFSCSYSQWNTLFYNNIIEIEAIDFHDVNNGIAVGTLNNTHPCILRTLNGGAKWDTVYTSLDSLSFADVTYIDSLKIIAVGGSGGAGIISTSNDGGVTWTHSKTNTFYQKVVFKSVNVGYMIGSGGTVFKSINGGNNWSLIKTISPYLNDLFFCDDSVGFVSTYDTIYKTIDAGVSWSKNILPNKSPISKIYFPSLNNGFAFSLFNGKYHLFKTNNSGVSWSYVDTIMPAYLILTSLYFVDDTIGYVGGIFTVMKTENAGNSWFYQSSTAPSPISFTDAVTDFCFLDKNNGFIGATSAFYSTKNGGGFPLDTKKNIKNNLSFQFYPNPSNGEFTIELNGENNTNDFVHVTIYDISGKEMFQENISLNSSSNVSLRSIPSGIYFATVVYQNQVFREKIIVH
jgi:photosystem II stability/assembly factor-like uncharacterized protein